VLTAGRTHFARTKICKIVAYGTVCTAPLGPKNAIYSGHLRLCQQPRAAHALRSDQFIIVLLVSSSVTKNTFNTECIIGSLLARVNVLPRLVCRSIMGDADFGSSFYILGFHCFEDIFQPRYTCLLTNVLFNRDFHFHFTNWQNPNSTNNSIELNLRLDYILTQTLCCCC
jgi:hypothetical protein